MSNDDIRTLARPLMKASQDYSKVFGVGYNKTGTTTLEAIFKFYGLECPNQQEQEIQLTKQVLACNYGPLKSFVSKYDAFQDLPFSQGDTFIVADALFPNSKFILTERDPDLWFESMCSFHKKMFEIDDLSTLTEQDVIEKFNYLYRGYTHLIKRRFLTFYDGYQRNVSWHLLYSRRSVRWDLLYNREYYIEQYLDRNQRIKKYFSEASERLLIIDVTAEADTARICDFLNIPTEFKIPMPHLKKSSSVKPVQTKRP